MSWFSSDWFGAIDSTMAGGGGGGAAVYMPPKKRVVDGPTRTRVVIREVPVEVPGPPGATSLAAMKANENRQLELEYKLASLQRKLSKIMEEGIRTKRTRSFVANLEKEKKRREKRLASLARDKQKLEEEALMEFMLVLAM